MNKVVLDVGAGPGQLAFLFSRYAGAVYAVEPASGFRRFIKEKATKENVGNLFGVDGFLDSIPFANNFADFLLTSQAIGWDLQQELREIERVLKPGGRVAHLFRLSKGGEDNQYHDLLTSAKWGYTCTRYPDTDGLKIKYHKILH